MQSVNLTARELVDVDAPAIAAVIQLRTGTADEQTRQTLNAIINVCYYVAKLAPRHAHLLPEIEAASNAALAGYQDVNALDVCCEIYKAIVRATPRKIIKRAITRAVLENSLEPA